MKTFCTIITADYYPKALALFKSIRKFNSEISLQVLVADNQPMPSQFQIPAGIDIIDVRELNEFPMVHELYRKYAHVHMNFFRWSLKPVFITYLLEKGFQKTIYLDCDMYFFNDYEFLFEELDKSVILLTPHWRNSNPFLGSESFMSLFTHGIFSAGFIGANKGGLSALHWWANACHFMMAPKPEIGIYDDQKYLDVLPVLFENVKIIRHRGCGVGANREETKRVAVNGQVMINGQDPIIFIHFDGQLIEGILKGYDAQLLPYLNEYIKVFEESGSSLSDYIHEITAYANASLIRKLKWKLKLRTRVKKTLYKLSLSI
jgi:hypothetical protein